MKKTINVDEFCDSFQGSYKDSFSYEGLRALYYYLEDLEQSNDIEIELDTVAIVCDFTEYESVIEAAEQYFTYANLPEGTYKENEDNARKYLDENTTIIEIEDTGRVIIQNF